MGTPNNDSSLPTIESVARDVGLIKSDLAKTNAAHTDLASQVEGIDRSLRVNHLRFVGIEEKYCTRYGGNLSKEEKVSGQRRHVIQTLQKMGLDEEKAKGILGRCGNFSPLGNNTLLIRFGSKFDLDLVVSQRYKLKGMKNSEGRVIGVFPDETKSQKKVRMECTSLVRAQPATVNTKDWKVLINGYFLIEGKRLSLAEVKQRYPSASVASVGGGSGGASGKPTPSGGHGKQKENGNVNVTIDGSRKRGATQPLTELIAEESAS